MNPQIRKFGKTGFLERNATCGKKKIHIMRY